MNPFDDPDIFQDGCQPAAAPSKPEDVLEVGANHRSLKLHFCDPFRCPAPTISDLESQRLYLCLLQDGLWLVGFPVGRHWATQQGTIVPPQIACRVVAYALLPESTDFLNFKSLPGPLAGGRSAEGDDDTRERSREGPVEPAAIRVWPDGSTDQVPGKLG